MKKVFKMSLFKKIFLSVLTGLLIILLFFVYSNFQVQKRYTVDNYLHNEKYEDGYNSMIDMFEQYLDEPEMQSQKALEYITSSDFKDKLSEMIDPVFGEDIVLRHYCYDSNEFNIIESTNRGSEYIQFEGKNYSISQMSTSQKESLLAYLKENMDKQYENVSVSDVEYCADKDELVYLKWDNDEYGKKTSTVNKNYISEIYVLDYFFKQEIGDGDLILVNSNDIEKAIQSIDFRYNDFAEKGYNVVEIGNMTFFVTGGYIAGGEEEGESINIFSVQVKKDLNKEVFDLCLEDYKYVYISAIFIMLFVSWCLSTIIAYPIGQLQLYALKISNNEFDEEVKVKSRDEIGSLANSIDIMRINLKHTIEQLNKEIEQVKKLESLRKDFINQFTHEMKTPLGIINGYSELIEETEDEQEREKYLNIINRETVRINELIQSMLKLSRLEAGKVELDIQQIDLEDIVTEIVDEYDVLLMKKQVKVEIEVKNKNIMADEKQIRTVIRNFLSNAIKHTDNRIIITIDNGVSIYNEGSQIEEERLESIWYTFVTGDKSGTGLGLAICRSVLELHGYRYGVKNKSDGVEFYFYN